MGGTCTAEGFADGGTGVEVHPQRDPRRIVLLDSPPLLLSSESRALVQIAGQVVLVVRAGGTPRQAVEEAIGYIGEGKPLGLILNQSMLALSEGYYGYGSYGDTPPPSS